MTQTYFPLMAGQMDFWDEWHAEPGSSVSTVAHATRLRGAVDLDALAWAITRVIAETDVMALRLRRGADGTPEQAVDPACRPVLRRIDLAGAPEAGARARAMMQADMDAPVDLCGGSLSAHWLIRIGPGDAIWYHRGHHLFLDGYAMALIERRCAAHYAHAVRGTDPGTGFAPLADLLAEENAWRASPRHAADRDAWRAALDGADLPSVGRDPGDYAADPLSASIDLATLGTGLRAMAARAGMGWPDLLTALTGMWLAAERGERAIWLPWMNRLGSVAARVPAMVVNILPLRLNPDPAAPLADALSGAATALRRLRRHGRYRIEDIGRDAGLDAGADGGTDGGRRFFFSPLVNVMPFEPPRFPGCDAGREVLAAGPGDGTNLTFAADPAAAGLTLHVDADPAFMDPAAFRRLCTDLPAFLARATDADPAEPLGEVLGRAPTPA